MKIVIERSGGLIGMSKRVTVDTQALPRSFAQNLEKYLTTTIGSRNKLSGKIKSNLPDCYIYKISGKVGTSKTQVYFNEFDVSSNLKSAIDYIFKKF